MLITDAEEMGLLGARAFTAQHRWANDVAAILNFEARGTSGPSFFLMETNHGNSAMLQAIQDAGVSYPLSDSLSYSIYKMLPNDTDLTVFRKEKDTPGFNFAFLDGHYHYHTAGDSVENLSLDALASQANYLMPMLDYFSNADLTMLKSDTDHIYFSLPYPGLVQYPFSWALPLSIVLFVVFGATVFLGLKNQQLTVKRMAWCALYSIGSLLIYGLISFLLMTLIYWIHPHYQEVLQGFPYNGSTYVLAFNLLAIFITYLYLSIAVPKYGAANTVIFAIFLWLLIALLSALFLPGGHYFMLVPLSGMLALLISFGKKTFSYRLVFLASIPVVFIFAPFFNLPVALGLQTTPVSGVLLVLMASVFLPCLFDQDSAKVPSTLFALPVVILLLSGVSQGAISPEQPRHNSLYYVQDEQTGSAWWASNDLTTDSWTHAYFANGLLEGEELQQFHHNLFPRGNLVSRTENRHINSTQISAQRQDIGSDSQLLHLTLDFAQRPNFIALIALDSMAIASMNINGLDVYPEQGKQLKHGDYAAMLVPTVEDKMTLTIEVATSPKGEKEEKGKGRLLYQEFHHSLFEHPAFSLAPRPPQYIAKAFVNSDTLVINQQISLP